MNGTRLLSLNSAGDRFRRPCRSSRARFADQVIPYRQCVHMCPQEAINGLFGRANNRLVIIKGSIDHRRRACQLTEPLAFTDILGREHRGEPGDYLVESSAGCLRITARNIFEDIYVPLRAVPGPDASALPVSSTTERRGDANLAAAPFRIDCQGRGLGERRLTHVADWV